MFDIGFSELVLVFVVGLVVLGPQRLPIAIRTVMGWISTIRGMAASVQNELAQELKLQELQESIKKAEALNITTLSPELSKTVEELKQTAEKMQNELAAAKDSIQPLTQEQVANIQQQIEQESQQLSQQATSEAEQFTPENANSSPTETAQVEHIDIAELAELDDEKLAAYYPPDDDFAAQTQPKDKQNVS